jgi:hypothetical protein
VTDVTMKTSLLEFFHNGKRSRLDLVELFLEKLRAILRWFESQGKMRFYSSSLLFIYDGVEKDQANVDVRMIDFAHVHEITDGGKVLN